MSREDFELNMDDKQMKALLRKAKRKHLIRNWIISICASIVVAFGLLCAVTYLQQKNFSKMERAIEAWHTIQGPNIHFYGHTKLSMGLTNSTISYSSYKNIAGQPVKWIDEIYEYSIWGYHQVNHNGNIGLDEEGPTEGTKPDYNSQTLQREMRFYLPFVTYKDYVNDLKNIGDLQNKVGEVALSFDKAYTVEQITQMLPKDVQPVWYWVDTYNEKKPTDYVGLTDANGTVFNAQMSTRVYGFQGSYTKNEEFTKDIINRNAKDFVETIKFLSKNEPSTLRGDMNKIYKEIKDIPPKDLPIYGVVVTGTTQSLQQLQGAPYIKAAVKGVVVDKQ
ncbi:anti sigma factor C-terminal domain-containing protein [Microbacteriaceae bacterium 4G12]